MRHDVICRTTTVSIRPVTIASITRVRRKSGTRGGLTTKIHAVVDANGLTIRLALNPGQAQRQSDGQPGHVHRFESCRPLQSNVCYLQIVLQNFVGHTCCATFESIRGLDVSLLHERAGRCINIAFQPSKNSFATLSLHQTEVRAHIRGLPLSSG